MPRCRQLVGLEGGRAWTRSECSCNALAAACFIAQEQLSKCKRLPWLWCLHCYIVCGIKEHVQETLHISRKGWSCKGTCRLQPKWIDSCKQHMMHHDALCSSWHYGLSAKTNKHS